MSWQYNGKTVNKISDLPKDEQNAFGFIYCIVLKHGGKSYEYYGRKNFFSIKNKKISNKKLKEHGKSAFRRKKQKRGKNAGEWYYYEQTKTEMNWKDYNSSSKDVLQLIRNGAQFTKYIVQIVQEESMMNYFECKHQFCSGVLEEERFLNGNILGRFHKKNIINKK